MGERGRERARLQSQGQRQARNKAAGLAGTSRCKWQAASLRGINVLLYPWIVLLAERHQITEIMNSSRELYFQRLSTHPGPCWSCWQRSLSSLKRRAQSPPIRILETSGGWRRSQRHPSRREPPSGLMRQGRPSSWRFYFSFLRLCSKISAEWIADLAIGTQAFKRKQKADRDGAACGRVLEPPCAFIQLISA